MCLGMKGPASRYCVASQVVWCVKPDAKHLMFLSYYLSAHSPVGGPPFLALAGILLDPPRQARQVGVARDLQRRAASERLAACVYRLRVGPHQEARHRLVPRLRGSMQRALAHAHRLRARRRARGEEQPRAFGVPLLGRLTEGQLDGGKGAVARAEEVLHRRAVAALLHLPQ